MTVRTIADPETPIRQLLDEAGEDGLLLKSGAETRYAVLPLDDDLIDFLIEHNPKFTEECGQIRARMCEGRTHTHEEVKQMLAEGGG